MYIYSWCTCVYINSMEVVSLYCWVVDVRGFDANSVKSTCFHRVKKRFWRAEDASPSSPSQLANLLLVATVRYRNYKQRAF